MAILATKNGWLYAGKVEKITKTFVHFKPVDEDAVWLIRKSDPTKKVFKKNESIEEINKWMKSPT